MRKVVLGIFIALIIFSSSCKTDFEVIDDWKEIGVVYCLLNPSEPFQYVRLQKAFINENTDAYQVADIADSIYYKENVKVQLINGRDTTTLEPFEVTTKEDGDFNNESYIAYRTVPGYVVYPRRLYKLRVFNTKTNYELTAQTRTVSEGNIEDPSFRSKVSFAICGTSNDFKRFVSREMRISSGRWVKFYDMSIDFFYDELEEGKTDTVNQSIEWLLGQMVSVSTLNTNLRAELKFNGEELFRFLGNNVSDDFNGDRFFKQIDFIFKGGGQEIFDYINVNRPSIGIVQKRPEYTNIEGGLGIFSSMIEQRVSYELDDCSIGRLVSDSTTRSLGFVR